MTSPQPPRPHANPAAGAALDEETAHLPVTTPGPSSAARPTAPSPYPQRPAFRPAPPPPPPGAAAPRAPRAPQSAPAPPPRRPRTERWEGTGFRPDIQGLRAIAVVLVLLSHAGFGFASGGYVGVDVFFVVSGFLITSLLVKEVFDTGKISIAGFYARRARRILPAASAVTIVTVIGAWLWFPVTRFEAVMQDAFTVIVYVINYRFVAESTEYLNADQMPSPFQQYWSLAVEEQFYLLWPLLLLGLLMLAKGSPRRTLQSAIALCSVVFVLSLIASVLITESSQPTAYYAAHTRAWELAAGAFLALTLQFWKKIPTFLAIGFGALGLAGIIASGVMYTEGTSFPGYTAALPVFGTVLVIIAGTARGKNPISWLLSTGPFLFVGKISYSLYLWHWPILILGPLALGVEGSVMLHVILLAGTFAMAQLSYEYIETPARTWKALKGNIMGLATGVLCSLLGIAMILTLTLGFSRVPENQSLDLDSVEAAEDLTAIEQSLRDGLDVQTVPDELTPSLAEAEDDMPAIYGDDCHLEFEEVSTPDHCVYGDTDSDTTVVLMGDSHAGHWFPALEAIAEEQGWALETRTKSSCTPVSVTVSVSQLDRVYDECDQWRDAAFDEFDQTNPDMVLLATSDAAAIVDPVSEAGAEEWQHGWSESLDRVTESAAETVVLTDTPRTSGDTAPDCIALNMEDVQQCTLRANDAIGNDKRRSAGVEAAEDAGATVVDTAGWFCIDGSCPMIVDDLLVMRDTHHITTAYSKSLSSVLFDAIPQLE